MTHEILGCGVMLFRNVIDVSTTCEFVKAIEEDGDEPYHPELTGVGFRFRPNSPSEETPSRFFVQQSHPICESWDRALYECLVLYCTTYPEAIRTVQWALPGHLISYENQQHIGWHSDDGIPKYPAHLYGIVPPDNQFALHCTLSTLLYLNDDYLGGEIEFRHADATYKPEAGSVLLYPSGFMGAHRVRTTLQGRRRAYAKFYGHGWPKGYDGQSLHWLPALGDDVCAL